MKTIIIINFKTYRESTGNNAEALAEKLDVGSDHEIILAVQNADLHRIKARLRLFAQHLDPVDYGAHTGSDMAECLCENGASGVLINHSEDRCDLEAIRRCVDACRRAGIVSCVCADKPELAEKVSEYRPNYIAIEPPELIGSGVSVSKARPEIVTDTIRLVKNGTPVLCGAGITSNEDLKIALKLGCSGIILSSAIVKSENPREKLLSLLG